MRQGLQGSWFQISGALWLRAPRSRVGLRGVEQEHLAPQPMQAKSGCYDKGETVGKNHLLHYARV